MADRYISDQPPALYDRVFSYYRHAFPATYAAYIPFFLVAGFEKRFGDGVLGCVYCGFTADCRFPPATVDDRHYAQSPSCRIYRLDDTVLNGLLERVRLETSSNRPSTQTLFEDDYLRWCCADADFRLLTFAYGQWGFVSRLPAAQLARNGFYYATKKHAARCLHCLLSLDNPNSISGSLEDWHKAQSPHCRFVQQVTQGTYDNLVLEHDPTGHLRQEDDEVQVVAQSGPSHMRASRASFPPALTATSNVMARPILQPKRRLQLTPAPTSSLSSMFQALNRLGRSDGELRALIKGEPSLIEAESSADFMERSETLHDQPSRTTTASETTLGSGNMTILDDYKCALCVTNKKDAAFIPCGHVYGCQTCSLRVKNAPTDLDRRCCVCRVTVTDVLPLLFTSYITEF